jgi:chemotaxis signal transduction protein
VISVDHLVEILPACALLPMPPSDGQTPVRNGVAALGILNYRGKAVPVAQLRLAPPAAGGAAQDDAAPAGAGRRCFLVIGKTAGGPLAALEVSRVNAVVTLDDGRIQPPGEVGLEGHPAVSGIYHLHDRLTFVIDGPSLGTTLAGRSATGVAHD